jgi:phosphoglucosamine mutase
VVIDEQGEQVNGDTVIALCATHVLRSGKLKKKTAVATVMSSIGLDARAGQRRAASCCG